MKIYDKIGEKPIKRAIEEFYKRAFIDPMICHFFIGFDILEITEKQQAFAIAMLGGPKNYHGRPLKDAHLPFTIKRPHFGRRQVLMRQVLEDQAIAEDIINEWMKLEQDLISLIVNV